MKKYIAFVCGHNSGRSQMAQAIFNNLKKLFPNVDRDYEAISWGTGIGKGINSRIISPMKAIGIDISNSEECFPKDANHPKVKEKYKDVKLIFTMGCMKNPCSLPEDRKIDEDWSLDDPADEKIDVTEVRNNILGKSLELLNALNKK